VPSLRSPSELQGRFAELEELSKARALAVAISDFETDRDFSYHGDRWFHAASTIKLAVLVGVYGAIHRGDLLPQSRVHVRNRFLSAYDGSPYRVRVDRDANAEVHREIGRTLRVSELADHMITSSSNLATNLLLDLVGLDVLQRTLDQFELEGIDLRRGVEDELAYQHGISNRVTARGLVGLLRLIEEERAFSSELSRHARRAASAAVPERHPRRPAARGARGQQDGRHLDRRARRGARLPPEPKAVRHRGAHRMGAVRHRPLDDDRRSLVHRIRRARRGPGR
jgi:beta-lactamase class A